MHSFVHWSSYIISSSTCSCSITTTPWLRRLSCSLGLLNQRPTAHSARCWLSLLHLISVFSGPQLIRAQNPFGLAWLVTLRPLAPTTLDQSSNHSTPRPVGDQLVVRGGQRTFLATTRIRSGGQEKIKQTNKHEQSLGLTKSRKRYATLHFRVRTIASVGYLRKFHKHWNADIFWLNLLRCAGPSLLCYCLRSPVLTAPVRGFTPTLCCPVANSSQLLFPANSHSRPLTTSGYGDISGPKILCLVSRQNRQRNRLFGGPPI